MIRATDYWVFIESEGNSLEDRRTTGKWIVIGPTIEEAWRLAPSIDTLVEQGRLYKVKFPHQEHPDYNFNKYPLPPMCFYADNPTRDETFRIVTEELGLETDEWKYD